MTVPPWTTRVFGFVFGLLAFSASIVGAALVGIFGVMPTVVLPRGRRERYAIYPAAAWAWVTAWGLLLSRPRVTGAVSLRDPDRGALFICNHRSWLDPVLLIALTHAQGLAKREVAWLPFIGLFAWLTGAVFVDRSSPDGRKRAREEVMWLLQRGARVHMFPEGTRTRDGAFGPRIHLTLPEDCWSAGLPVVPCAVWGTERVLPPNHAAGYPLQPCHIHIGAALYPQDYPDAEAFGQACWAAVVSDVERLKGIDEKAR